MSTKPSAAYYVLHTLLCVLLAYIILDRALLYTLHNTTTQHSTPKQHALATVHTPHATVDTLVRITPSLSTSLVSQQFVQRYGLPTVQLETPLYIQLEPYEFIHVTQYVQLDIALQQNLLQYVYDSSELSAFSKHLVYLSSYLYNYVFSDTVMLYVYNVPHDDIVLGNNFISSYYGAMYSTNWLVLVHDHRRMYIGLGGVEYEKVVSDVVDTSNATATM